MLDATVPVTGMKENSVAVLWRDLASIPPPQGRCTRGNTQSANAMGQGPSCTDHSVLEQEHKCLLNTDKIAAG